MQFDNYRDPTAESVWIKKNGDYNVQVPVDSCYSNLSHYGTNFGTPNDPQQHSESNLGGGLVKSIVAPYPAEQFPEIMLQLGVPHEYKTAFAKKEIFNCNSYITAKQYYDGTKHGSRPVDNLDRSPTISPLNNSMVLSYRQEQAIKLIEAFEKGFIKLYHKDKNVYNWIKKYVCPKLSLSVLNDLAKKLESILATNTDLGMKVANITELLLRKCII